MHKVQHVKSRQARDQEAPYRNTRTLSSGCAGDVPADGFEDLHQTRTLLPTNDTSGPFQHR
jgi:hypothetical protein